MENLGKKGRDKVTGFEGIIVGRCEYLYGCTNYGLAPKVGADGKRGDIEWFDRGRIEILETDSVSADSVSSDRPGGESRRETPRQSH